MELNNIDGKGNNLQASSFSVYNSKSNKCAQKESPNCEIFTTNNQKFKVHNGPPCTAKKLLPEESLEDFLCQHIESMKGISHPNPPQYKQHIQAASALKQRTKVTMPGEQSPKVMIQKRDPKTGCYGWQVQDEGYDFHQEIARSAFADMLHDSERNDKYYEGIRAAVERMHREGKKAHVLDIGTGTGLLAMMAARCGADTIHACEAFSPISECAEKVIEENGLADRIRVIHKRSTDVTVGEAGDLPRRCNILVTEVFDTELIGEGAIRTFNHAHANLLERDCLVVPTSGTVFAQVVESEWMQRWNRLAPWGDVVPSQAVRRCPGAAAVHDLQLSQVPLDAFRTITQPEPVFRFDWTCRSPIPENDSTALSTTAVASGTAQMVFMWWSLNMDPEGKIVLSCAPWWAHPSQPRGPDEIPWRDHWMQAVYYLPEDVSVRQGQPLTLHSSHDEFSLWFNLSTSQSCVKTERPVCECLLHASCSRTRIAMLNDPSRREKYWTVLRRLVRPDTVVISYGNASLLGLMAAKMGAQKVYHLEDNPWSRNLLNGLVKDNNLESKVFVASFQDFHSHVLISEAVSKQTVVLGEPYLQNARLPWHIDMWLAQESLFSRNHTAVVPLHTSLKIMPVQFDHLHKICAPLGSVSGFNMTAFDQLVQSSSSISDSSVEVHPLWEYSTVCLGFPKEIQKFDPIKDFFSTGNMPFNVSGMWNGMVLWVDVQVDADITVSTGPVEPPVPGKRVRWDPYTRQAVCFITPEISVTHEDFLIYRAAFKHEQINYLRDIEYMNDIEFTFKIDMNKLESNK